MYTSWEGASYNPLVYNEWGVLSTINFEEPTLDLSLFRQDDKGRPAGYLEFHVHLTDTTYHIDIIEITTGQNNAGGFKYRPDVDGLINDGEISTRLGLKGIPFLAEKIIVERDLSFLEEYFCRYHISQISSKKTVSVIKKAKKEGKIFSTGVSINNLSLNENDIGDFKTFLKLSPPLRTESDRRALVESVSDGTIDVIVSDHKPEDEESKRLTFAQAATGASGVETLLPLALELFHNKSIKLNKLIAALTCNPAKILDINKGTLNKGADADLCIFDINKPWIVNKENIKSKSKNTPIEDRKLQGQVLKTFVKGELVYESN